MTKYIVQRIIQALVVPQGSHARPYPPQEMAIRHGLRTDGLFVWCV